MDKPTKKRFRRHGDGLKALFCFSACLLLAGSLLAQPSRLCQQGFGGQARRQFAYEMREGDPRPKPNLTPCSPSLEGRGQGVRSPGQPAEAQGAKAGWQPNGIAVCDTAPSGLPQIVSDGKSGAIICWTECYRDQVNLDTDIYAQRVDSGGNFVWQSQGVPVCSLKGVYSEYPAMIADGRGGAIIAWEDSRGGLGYTRVFAQRLDSLGNRMWPENGVLVCNQMSGYVDLCSDEHGGAIIAYLDGRNIPVTSDDIYAQRIDSAGNPAWAIDGVPVCTADSIQFWPAVVSDDKSGAIITWHDRRNGNYDLYAQRIDDLGNAGWQVNGIPVCTTVTTDEEYPKIVTDGSGGGIIGWTMGDIYAQRVDSSGVKPWAENGILVCGKPGAQTRPSLSYDGNKGAVLCWLSALDTNIYVQRMDSNGNLLWDTNGVLILDVPRGGDYQIILSSTNTTLVIWDDLRNSSGYSDQYIQNIDMNSKILWDINGIPLCTLHMEYQTYPQLTSDGLGGAICTWFGNPIHGDNHIYAQRIYTDGTPGGIDGEPFVHAECRVQYLKLWPNPSEENITISFTIPEETPASICLYNITGQLIRVLAKGRFGPGSHSIRWNGRDENGSLAVSGVYILRISGEGWGRACKIIVLR